jgi:release factor glutamine methyltransferase
MNIKAILADSTNRLSGDEAAFEAQLLLQHVLNVNRAWLISHADDALEPNSHAVFEALIQRRINGEPIAYILGYREFYGLKLKVTPDTLIPRQDTETLVEAALAKMPQHDTTSAKSFRRLKVASYGDTGSESSGVENLDQKILDSDFCRNDGIRVLDLGTGTGAIALAIAKNRPHAQVTAVDFSEKALAVACQNAKDLNILNCQFLQSDWLSALKLNGQNKHFDVIVSNPPYIEQDDAHLSQGDLRFEPLSALASGKDGFDDIRTIISQAKHHLKLSGWLMLEHGYNQAQQVANLLAQSGFDNISHVRDLAGIERVSYGQFVD